MQDLEFVRSNCAQREEEARYEKYRCYKLLQENIIEIGASVELYPFEIMQNAIDCLDYNVRNITDSIVRKYAEHLAEYVRNKLATKYALNKFSTFCVRLIAPSLNENHIKVEINEEWK